MNLTLIDLPQGVRFSAATKDKVLYWWGKLKNFDRLFDDNTFYDEVNFAQKLFEDRCYILEVEDNGIIVFNNVIEHLRAQVHVSFWDFKLSGRLDLLKECLLWAILQFDLHRVETLVPEFSRALKRFIENKMKFKYEGTLRDFIWYKGELCDMIIYSILREEVFKCQ
jgi:RimJ/RimL family protein N-acetyltransferase